MINVKEKHVFNKDLDAPIYGCELPCNISQKDLQSSYYALCCVLYVDCYKISFSFEGVLGVSHNFFKFVTESFP